MHPNSMQMRACALILGMLSATVAQGQTPEPFGVAKKKLMATVTEKFGKLPVPVQRAIERGDYVALQNVLVAELQKKESVSPVGRATLRLVMMHEWVRVTGAEVLSAMASSDKAKKRFLAEFAVDDAWQEIYLSCGLVPYQKEMGMDVLYRIWIAENGKVKNKALAVALASCWGGGETWPEPAIAGMLPTKYDPVRRYQFFQRQEAEGKLHVNYPKLKAWELRFVVANPQQDWDDASYEFAARYINMPWDKYDISCWAATYTGTSKFGDSVQGGAYNLPFGDESEAERTLLNGGVCGAMSHLGAVAAMAHGIPAYTCGQPGHCAYAVRPERGKWIGGFGGPDGGMHNHIFGNSAPTSYRLMEAVFADDAAVKRAYRKSFCARALEAMGQAAAAEAMWKEALKDTPMHPFFRAGLHALMLKRGVQSDECYEYLMNEFLPHYAGHGMAATDAMKDLAPVVEKMDDTARLALYQKVHEALALTPASWALKPDEVVTEQSASMQSPEARVKLLTTVFTEHMKQGDGTMFGQLLEWAVKNFTSTEEGSRMFNVAFASAAEKVAAASSAGDAKVNAERDKKMVEAYGKAIVAAEQARSAPAFQALTKGALALDKSGYKAPPLEKASELQGAPAAAAMIRISSSCPYDTPCYHAGMVLPSGGKCHTAKEEKPTFIVELAQHQFPSGCIIRKTDGNEDRMKKALVYTSEDGATWFKRAEVADMPKEWVVQFPAGTGARWVKLEFENEAPDFAHLSHFVVYSR